MNLLLPFIILLILSVIFAGSLNDSNKRLMVVIVVLILIILLCCFHIYNTSNLDKVTNIIRPYIENFQYAPLSYNMRPESENNIKTSYDGYIFPENKNNTLLVNYDNLILKDDPKDDVPIINNVFNIIPSGKEEKLEKVMNNELFPTIDGKKTSEKRLFMFAKNNYGGNCKSQYSTNSGMLCPSKEQINFISSRGNNITPPFESPYI